MALSEGPRAAHAAGLFAPRNKGGPFGPAFERPWAERPAVKGQGALGGWSRGRSGPYAPVSSEANLGNPRRLRLIRREDASLDPAFKVVWLTNSRDGLGIGLDHDEADARVAVEVDDAHHWPAWSKAQGIHPSWARYLAEGRDPRTFKPRASWVATRALAWPEWRAIEVRTPDGWEVVWEPPEGHPASFRCRSRQGSTRRGRRPRPSMVSSVPGGSEPADGLSEAARGAPLRDTPSA